MKKLLIFAAVLAALISAAAEAPKLNMRRVCCRYPGWQGIEITFPVSGTNTYELQYKTSLSQTNWTTVTNNPTFGPFVEDGTFFYYLWLSGSYPPGSTNPPVVAPSADRFWRVKVL